jgi:hypothetical protein
VLVAGSDDRAHVKTVEIGIKGGSEVQILSGIKEGEAVITSGGYALPDKTQIKVEAPPPAEKDAASADEPGAQSGDKKKPAEKPKD